MMLAPIRSHRTMAAQARSAASRRRAGRTGAAIALALLLAACGKQQPLEPASGHALPPKPATSPTQPTPVQLLTPPPSFRPGRSDELLTKSATRPDDRFDLPPR